MGRYDVTSFSDLVGKTFTEIQGLQRGSDRVTFICSDGKEYMMQYFDDCCASCSIEDISGVDVEDLLNTPIVRAESPSSLDKFDEKEEAKGVEGGWEPESYTWTFYILGTRKGTMTIRWFGSSNGYYSESPTFFLNDDNDN